MNEWNVLRLLDAAAYADDQLCRAQVHGPLGTAERFAGFGADVCGRNFGRNVVNSGLPRLFWFFTKCTRLDGKEAWAATLMAIVRAHLPLEKLPRKHGPSFDACYVAYENLTEPGCEARDKVTHFIRVRKDDIRRFEFPDQLLEGEHIAV